MSAVCTREAGHSGPCNGYPRVCEDWRPCWSLRSLSEAPEVAEARNGGYRPHNVGGCECPDNSKPCTSTGRRPCKHERTFTIMGTRYCRDCSRGNPHTRTTIPAAVTVRGKCFYCGEILDQLKAHIESCRKHPLSAALARITDLEAAAKRNQIYCAYLDEIPTLIMSPHEVADEVSSTEVVCMWDNLKAMAVKLEAENTRLATRVNELLSATALDH